MKLPEMVAKRQRRWTGLCACICVYLTTTAMVDDDDEFFFISIKLHKIKKFTLTSSFQAENFYFFGFFQYLRILFSLFGWFSSCRTILIDFFLLVLRASLLRSFLFHFSSKFSQALFFYAFVNFNLLHYSFVETVF